MSILSNGGVIEDTTPLNFIEKSLRFRGEVTPYLERTPTTEGSKTKFTFSCWCKKIRDSNQHLFSVFGLDGASTQLSISSDKLTFNNWPSGAISSTIIVTNNVFVDTAAWYHFVFAIDMSQANAQDACRIYVNGQLQEIGVVVYTQGVDTLVNSLLSHRIGYNNGSSPFNGYLYAVTFVDGLALTPDNFGETNAETNTWIPKRYVGQYGINGFYLPFSNNSNTVALGYDYSDNNNNWIAHNISLDSGNDYDNVTDVPELRDEYYSNFATLNPLVYTTNTFSKGYLSCTAATNPSPYAKTISTIGFKTGKYYAEIDFNNAFSSGTDALFGITGNTDKAVLFDGVQFLCSSTGTTVFSNGWTPPTIPYPDVKWLSTDIAGLAVNMDSKVIKLFKNGVEVISYDFSLTAALNIVYFGCGQANGVTYNFNFGQRPFVYAPPTGYKCLNTYNLPTPSIINPNKYMDATLYTGTGVAHDIVNEGEFAPDLVWIKRRDNYSDHCLYDTVRGAAWVLSSDSTGDQSFGPSYSLTSFNTNGFGVPDASFSAINGINDNYVGWQWKKGSTSGFDIVTYTGTGVAHTIPHNLNAVPKMIITKKLNGNSDWGVYHESLGNTKCVLLNSMDNATTSSTYWNNTSPTSTTFTVGTADQMNTASATYVAYLFSEIISFSSFGTYVGNNSNTAGSFIYTGFTPKFLMIKKVGPSTPIGSWFMIDTAREPFNIPSGQQIPSLWANDTSYEGSAYYGSGSNTLDRVEIVSNGFKLRGQGTFTLPVATNGPGSTYVYAAFAENPIKYANAN